VPCKKKRIFYLEITFLVGRDRPAVVERLSFGAMAVGVLPARQAVGAFPADVPHNEARDPGDGEVLHRGQGFHLLGARGGLTPHTKGVLLKRERDDVELTKTKKKKKKIE
jgi:hypothetical protein